VHVDQAVCLQAFYAGAIFIGRSALAEEDDVDLADVDLAVIGLSRVRDLEESAGRGKALDLRA
jgi:hypothetical protein